ncbi:MAG: sulfatase [Sedimentisphaerales bacterium]|nr:sulfatase [Sedimentisphaerales bacterium]
MRNMAFNRRNFLKMLGGGAAAVVMSSFPPDVCASSKKRKPNVILILVDDMGWTDAACYGSQCYHTPQMDRLCREGMKFTDAYAACAVCSPTRAAVMTGRYPARLGITDWIVSRFQGGTIPADKKNPEGYDFAGRPDMPLLTPRNALWMEREEITIAEALKPAGYVSCHVGKWHLGADDWYPDKQGFDFNIGGCDFGQPPTYYDPYHRRSQGDIPTLPARKEGEYLTDREADEAVDFVRRHADRPFFLYLAHYAVHTPLQAREDLFEKYKTRKTTNQKNPIYAAMIESVDMALGKVLDVLDELQLAKDTVVIFTSDNGGLAGQGPWAATSNLPLREGKGYPYEGGIRVPLMVRWSGTIQAGSVCPVPVTSVDLFPTICQTAGVGLPNDRPIDGESLLPLFRQAGSLQRDALFWHFPHYRGNDVVPYSIVRQGDWKLIKRYQGRPFELFNLRLDLSERKDLSDKQPEKVQELDALLQTWLKDVHAKMPQKNPIYNSPNV